MSTAETTPNDPVYFSAWRSISTPKSAWIRMAAYLGGVVLGLVLLIAAWAKALDPIAFAKEIQGYGLDFLLPAAAVAMIALALEVFLGGALVLGIRRLEILIPSAILVVFFLFLTGRNYYQDMQGTLAKDTSCGCFGNLVERTPAEAFWQDLFLMVPALLLAFVARSSGGPWPKFRSALVGLATLGILFLGWKAPELPLDNLATRLKPGVNALEICAGREDQGSRACMSDVIPEIGQGEHVLVIADLEDEAFTGAVEQLNEYQWSGSGPKLWTLHSASEEVVFQFQFGVGPAFDMRETPAPLLRPLYRTLPRSFTVRDGKVLQTWSGLPPFDQLTEAVQTADTAHTGR